jgi:hypothetical protein
MVYTTGILIVQSNRRVGIFMAGFFEVVVVAAGEGGNFAIVDVQDLGGGRADEVHVVPDENQAGGDREVYGQGLLPQPLPGSGTGDLF